MVECLETSSDRKAWLKGGWKNVLSMTQAETTRASSQRRHLDITPLLHCVNNTPMHMLSLCVQCGRSEI